MKNLLKVFGIIVLATVMIFTMTVCDINDNNNENGGENSNPIDNYEPNLQTVATPAVSPAAGAVASGTKVTISCSTSGAEIWYTTNNSTPAKNGTGSTKYTATITVNSAVTIKAIAVKDGMNNSQVLTAAYTISSLPPPPPLAWVDPCKQTTQLTGATSLSKGNGNQNLSGSPYGYEIFVYEGGGGSMSWYGKDQGGGGAYKAVWDGYYLARLGYFWGNGGPYTQYKNIYVDYNYNRTADNTSHGGMIGVYGWSRNPSAAKEADKLIEYYIVDDWLYNNTPQMGIDNVDNPNGERKQLGTYNVDGTMYTLFYTTRTDQSIDGTKTFAQIVGVRQGRRTAGTISVTKHFAEWSNLGVTLGNMYEVKFKVESFGGNGNLDLTYLYLSQEDSVRPADKICNGDCGSGPKAVRITQPTQYDAIRLSNENFNFANGSSIYIKGKNAGAATQIIMNMNSGGWSLLDNFGDTATASGASFETTLTIDATEAATIVNISGENDFAGLSFRGNDAGAVIVLEQLQIKNPSGTVLFDLAQVLSGLSTGTSNFSSIFSNAGFHNSGSMTYSVIYLD